MIRSFAPDTVALMGRVCDESYVELEGTPPGATTAIRGVIAAVHCSRRNTMKILTPILALGLAFSAAGPALAEGEPKSRTECADMKDMIWDDATKTCNPIKK